MKKAASLLGCIALVTILFCSCKKKYSCVCEGGSGSLSTTEEIIRASSEENAKATCANVASSRSVECTLQ